MEVLKKSAGYVLPSMGNRLTYLSLLLAGIFSALLFALAPTPASMLTTVPTKMNFQGRLTDTSGNIKANGTYNMRLKLYTVASGGSSVWSEDRLVSATQGVTVTNGTFSTQLGSITTLPASLFASGGLYLEVELPTPSSATTSSPVWTEGPMTPRNQMATSAYAYNAETLDGFDSADFGQVAVNNTFTGMNTFRNAVNSTSAFAVQDTASNILLNIDTTAAGEIRMFDLKGAPGTWKTSANPLPLARNFHRTVAVNGYMYVIGGTDTAGTDLATVSYTKIQADGEIQSWQAAASLPETLKEPSMAVSGSTIYVMGGTSFKEVVYFTNVKPDGSLAPWKATTPMTGYGNYAASAVVMNGYLYNIGGWGAGATGVIYAKIQADGQLGSWNVTTALPTGKLGLTTASVNGYIYVIGGACCGTVSNSIYYAKQNSDGTVGSWSTASFTLPANTAGHGSTISNGYLYVFGGKDSGAAYNTVHYAKLNQSGDLGPWSTSSLTLPTGIFRIGTVGIVNGTAYIAGGFDGTNVLSSVYYSRLGPSLTIGGNIDLVSPQGGSFSDGTGSSSEGSMGGSITAGNITAVGSLQITGSSFFKGDMASSGSFAIQNTNGNVLSVDSGSSTVSLGQASTTDTFTKLTDPATLPAGTGNRVAYSPDGIYLSVAHSTSPFITIYKRSGDTFTKLANPASLPTGTAYGTAFSPDGIYLSVAHSTSPFITIYKRSGDTFTKLANPASLPTDIGVATTFSPDGNYLIATQNTAPNINIYKRSGDTFTKLANPASLPAAGANGVSFSPNGIYMTVVSSSSPYLIIYKRSGDTFTKLADPAVMPAGSSFDTTFSPDGIYMTVAHSTSPFITIYKRSGDTFTKLADPATIPGSSGRGVSFSADGKYLSITADGGPGVIIYTRSGDTFTKIADPAFLPTTGGAKDIKFSNDSQYLTAVYSSSPYITVYRVGSGNSTSLTVNGAVTTNGALQVSTLSVGGQTNIGGATVIHGALNVAGPATIGDGLGEAAAIIQGGTTGSQRLSFTSDGITRWSVGSIGGGTTPDFHIQRYSTSGAYLDSPIRVDNTAGNVYIKAPVSGGGVYTCMNATSGLIVQGSACTNASSARYKENVVSLGSSTLDILGQLRPVSFDWKAENAYTTANGSKSDFGLIAEEVARVMPHLVAHDENGNTTGVNYQGLIPFLIQAIKEQQSQIVQLQGGNPVLSSLTVQGRATVQSLTVAGDAHVKGNIFIDGHLVSGGGTPTVDFGLATCLEDIGVTGTDTAGTIRFSVNAPGCSSADLRAVFAKAYGAAPYATLTSKDRDSARLQSSLDADTQKMTFSFDGMQVGKTYRFSYHVIQ